MMLRNNFPQTLIKEGLKHKMFQWVEDQEKAWEYRELFREDTSDQAYELDVEFAGVTSQVQVPEGVATTYVDPVQGGSVRYTHLEYRLGTKVTNRMMEDDKIGLVKQVPDMHIASAKFTREQVAANVFNNGFTTTTTTDGVSLFNSAHPLLGGPSTTALLPLPSTIGGVTITAGTYPNSFSTALAPSQTAIQQMMIIMRRMVNGVGFPIQGKLAYIVCPPEQETTWSVILASAFQPGGAQNDLNYVTKFGLKIFPYTYLTSGTKWFAVGQKEQTNLWFYERQAVKSEFADEFDIRGFKMQTSQIFSCGASRWNNTFGSNFS
jgi:Mu-like prophage major head subunit gpT